MADETDNVVLENQDLMTKSGGWHVDKTIPIALIFAISVQGAVGIWWASDITSRLMTVEASENKHSIAVEAMLKILEGRTERIIRLEEKTGYTVQALERIEKKLDEVVK